MNTCKSLVLPALFLLAASLSAQKTPEKWVPVQQELPNEMLTAAPVGPKSTTDIIHLSLSIPFRDADGIQAFVNSVSDPRNPNYRHFIGPDEIGRRFGISTSDLKKITDYLVTKGITPRTIGKARLSILADATVAQVESAFNTTINEYKTIPFGKATPEIRYSNSSPPNVPANIRSFVTYIGGLENFNQPKPQTPLTPDQLRVLYNVAPLYTNSTQGQGRTIAISNYDGYRLSNVTLEYSQFKLPTPPGGVGSNITRVPINGLNGNTYSHVAAEGDVDIQCALAMAPLCHLLIYDDPSDGTGGQPDPISLMTKEVDDNLADIVSESWGWSGSQAFYLACHNQHVSMNAAGITYMCASGDSGSGSNGTGGIASYPYPDIDPEVLIVGGTSVVTDVPGNRYTEVGWTGSGGGWVVSSDAFNIHPSYQVGTGVPSATQVPYRMIPDVALDADPNTGFEIFTRGGFYQIGGTSCATPTMAGGLADCEQFLIAQNALPADSLGHQRFGRIQDLLYSFNGDSSVFFDVTSGTNGSLPNTNTSSATVGWDTVTGWGAMSFNGFANKVLNMFVPVSLSLTPSTVVGSIGTSATVTISGTSPNGGLTVTVTSSTPDATVPTTVTVPAGASSVTFPVSTSVVASQETATITASAMSANQGVIKAVAALTINPLALVSVEVNPTSVAGGTSSTGKVTLSGISGPGGTAVTLTSSNAGATVPASITVPSGSTFGTFQVGTSAASSTSIATITATYAGGNQTATLTITPSQLAGLTLSYSSVFAGYPSIGTVSLASPAPTGGAIVTLSSNISSATVPASVSVPAGSTSATFTVNTVGVDSTTMSTITATLAGATRTVNLGINAAVINGFSIAPSTVVGGSAATGTISLHGQAGPSGIVATVVSNSPSATVPASVSMPFESTSGTFSINTSVVNSATTAIFAVTYGTTVHNSLSITPGGLASIALSPNSVYGGSSATGTVTLSASAPSGGTVVTLSSSSASAFPPATVTVPAGANAATFTVATSGVDSASTATITGTLGATTRTASLSINAATISGFSVNPSSVVGGSNATGTVMLRGQAGPSGIVVTLSSNIAAATVPASLTIPFGAPSGTFTIGTAVVSSPLNAVLSVSYGVTVYNGLTLTPGGLSSISVSPNMVYGGSPTTGTVTLSAIAPSGGTTVSLTSSNVAATVPASVTVPAGSLTTTFAVNTSGVDSTLIATISGTLGATSRSAGLTVKAPVLSGFSIAPSSVVGGSAAIGTVSLRGQAGPSGATISTSSNNAAAIVPATVTIPAGATYLSFNINTSVVSSNATAILAVSYDVTVHNSLTIIPGGLVSLSLAPDSLYGGYSSIGTVTLSAVAPPGGTTVSLASSNGSATLPANVIVPEGATSATFPIDTTGVDSTLTASITATLGAITRTAGLTIRAAVITGFVVSPSSVVGGASATGTINFRGHAGPSGINVSVSSDNPAATVPGTVAVPAGSNTGTFTIDTSVVSATTRAVFSVTYGVTTHNSLTITTGGLLSMASIPKLDFCKLGLYGCKLISCIFLAGV